MAGNRWRAAAAFDRLVTRARVERAAARASSSTRSSCRPRDTTSARRTRRVRRPSAARRPPGSSRPARSCRAATTGRSAFGPGERVAQRQVRPRSAPRRPRRDAAALPGERRADDGLRRRQIGVGRGGRDVRLLPQAIGELAVGLADVPRHRVPAAALVGREIAARRLRRDGRDGQRREERDQEREDPHRPMLSEPGVSLGPPRSPREQMPARLR